MPNREAKLLDVVALLNDRPDHGLVSGQVGAIVEMLGEGVFEVEFCDLNGRTLGLAEVTMDEILVLCHEGRPALAA